MKRSSRYGPSAVAAVLATASFFLVAGVVSAPGEDLQPRGGAAALDPQRARELALSAADRIDSMYVEAVAAGRIAARIRERAESGAYDGAGTASRLADLLTRDLQEIGKDRHLGVRFDPGFAGGPRIWRGPRDENAPASGPGAPGDRIVIREEGEVPSGPVPRTDSLSRTEPGPTRVVRAPRPTDPVEAASRRRSNYGLRSAERLDGNVGLLDIRGFVPLASSRETAAAAMAFLANTDAVIVDLRDCPGGSPDTVSFLASYFFGPEKRELFSRYDRVADQTTTEYTTEDLPGRRMPDADLWVLVGPNTASAGESFAYLLQQFGRGTVVGERTAGAGHNNVLLPLGEGLVLSVSVARPIHPRTGKGWEGEGVKPDLAAPAETALAAAHAAALRKLLARAPDERRRRELTWAIERVEAHRERPGVSPVNLAAYAGVYGERTVTLEKGRLVCRIGSGRARTLDPLGRDAFAWDEQTRASFVRDAAGRPVELVVERSDGTVERFSRAAPMAGAVKETR